MDYKSYELEGHPDHYTSLSAAITASLNPLSYVAYYVNDKGERNTLVNGRIITICYPDGSKKPMTQKI